MPKTEAAAKKEDWEAHLAREEARYRDGESRLTEDAPEDDPADTDSRQRQLTRLGNAAGGAGLSLLMLGRRDEAADWFVRAAERYRESFRAAPPGSWGRPIGAMKAMILADDWPKAVDAASWALEAGAAESDSPIGRYAAALAYLVLGQDVEARIVAETLVGRDDFPRDVADALLMIAGLDRLEYDVAVENVLDSFEKREEFLEDIRVADTVLVLQELAAARGLEVELPLSDLLPT